MAMYVNWNVQVLGPGGIPIPTYGNYGGPGYSAGEVLANPNQPVDYNSAPPRDALDRLFQLHDQAYDSPDPLVRATGDRALLEGISNLPNAQLDPEARAYGGLATLFAIQQIIVVNKHPELLSERDIILYTREALHDIERGLAKLDPGERAELQEWLEETASAAGGTIAEGVFSLMGSIELNGFEAHLGDLHLAGPKLADTVVDALAYFDTTDAHAFDFGAVAQVLGIQPNHAILIVEEMVGQVTTPVAHTLFQAEHRLALPNEETLTSLFGHHGPGLIDYLLT